MLFTIVGHTYDMTLVVRLVS